MRLQIATIQQMDYAVKNFHYSKSRPKCVRGFSVYNGDNQWCGCILYGSGANYNLGKQLGLQSNQIYELVRVALNGKQQTTSMAVAKSLKQIRKLIPTLKVIVSYADMQQNHYGVIYQATNWIYVGESPGDQNFIVNGKRYHRRTLYSEYKTSSFKYFLENIDPTATKIKLKPKHKYYFIYDRWLRKKMKCLSKPYPKSDGNCHL